MNRDNVKFPILSPVLWLACFRGLGEDGLIFGEEDYYRREFCASKMIQLIFGGGGDFASERFKA